MPKTKRKVENKRFNTDLDVLKGTAVKDAPHVGGEFITEDGEWQGQTVQVQSEKHLEDDLGTGEHVILRTFQFVVNPEAFKVKPSVQQIFESHQKGIEAFLWQDGLSPIKEIPPRFVLAKDEKTYLFIVASHPSLGQAVLEKSQTLSQIAHENNRR